MIVGNRYTEKHTFYDHISKQLTGAHINFQQNPNSLLRWTAAHWLRN